MPGYLATRAIKQAPPPSHQLDGTLTEGLDDPGTDLQVALGTHERSGYKLSRLVVAGDLRHYRVAVRGCAY